MFRNFDHINLLFSIFLKYFLYLKNIKSNYVIKISKHACQTSNIKKQKLFPDFFMEKIKLNIKIIKKLFYETIFINHLKNRKINLEKNYEFFSF